MSASERRTAVDHGAGYNGAPSRAPIDSLYQAARKLFTYSRADVFFTIHHRDRAARTQTPVALGIGAFALGAAISRTPAKLAAAALAPPAFAVAERPTPRIDSGRQTAHRPIRPEQPPGRHLAPPRRGGATVHPASTRRGRGRRSAVVLLALCVISLMLWSTAVQMPLGGLERQGDASSDRQLLRRPRGHQPREARSAVVPRSQRCFDAGIEVDRPAPRPPWLPSGIEAVRRPPRGRERPCRRRDGAPAPIAACSTSWRENMDIIVTIDTPYPLETDLSDRPVAQRLQLRTRVAQRVRAELGCGDRSFPVCAPLCRVVLRSRFMVRASTSDPVGSLWRTGAERRRPGRARIATTRPRRAGWSALPCLSTPM